MDVTDDEKEHTLLLPVINVDVSVFFMISDETLLLHFSNA